MREDFTDAEKELLVPFVKWARRPDAVSEPTNPVLLLTGNELFCEFSVNETWKKLQGRYAQFADYHHTRHLRGFAEATQAIYLGTPTFHADLEAAWKKRAARRAAAAVGAAGHDRGDDSSRSRAGGEDGGTAAVAAALVILLSSSANAAAPLPKRLPVHELAMPSSDQLFASSRRDSTRIENT